MDTPTISVHFRSLHTPRSVTFTFPEKKEDGTPMTFCDAMREIESQTNQKYPPSDWSLQVNAETVKHDAQRPLQSGDRISATPSKQKGA